MTRWPFPAVEKTTTPASEVILDGAQPMPGLSKRAPEQLQPRRFGVYSRARPVEKK